MRKGEFEGELLSYKRRLSSDAKIILALLGKQPLTVEEICEKAEINISTFYRTRPLLERKGIIKEYGEGFVLWTFNELEEKIDKALQKLMNTYVAISIDDLANEVGEPPDKIQN